MTTYCKKCGRPVDAERLNANGWCIRCQVENTIQTTSLVDLEERAQRSAKEMEKKAKSKEILIFLACMIFLTPGLGLFVYLIHINKDHIRDHFWEAAARDRSSPAPPPISDDLDSVKPLQTQKEYYFRDAKGNLVSSNSPSYDSKGNYCEPGGPFYDYEGNLINPKG